MSKKFNIREWVLSVKYWSLLFIPHISIFLIFIIYTLVGASIIQEIESDDSQTTSSTTLETTSIPNTSIKSFDRERERLLSKIIDKRQTADVQQYIKYINKHIREYEQEIRKTYNTPLSSSSTTNNDNLQYNEPHSRWTFAGSLYFIGTTLTTIGSYEFTPITKMGKLFLMIYVAIGIPLTLVFLSDLSLLITRLIKYFSLILLRIYSTHYFLHIRQWTLFRFIEKQLNISIPIPTHEDDSYSPDIQQSSAVPFENFSDENIQPTNRSSFNQGRLSQHHHIKRLQYVYNLLIDTLQDVNDDTDLTMSQLVITLFLYILIGGCLITTNSYFDSIYLCFTSIFTISLRNYYNTITTDEHNIKLMLILVVYLLFGLAIVSLCIKAVQTRIQTSLEDIGKKLLRDFVEFLRQMGFHELSTDDILDTTDRSLYPLSRSGSFLQGSPRLRRTLSFVSDQFLPISCRPIGITEPVRRLSNGHIIRAYKTSEDDTSTDKSVQVNTIIRSCGRCAGSTPSPATSMLSVRKHGTISASPSSPGENSSGCEEDEFVPSTLPTANLDRLRQRRATLVAKTIINQMATQPSPLHVEESVTPFKTSNTQRNRLAEATVVSPPVSFRYSTKDATNKRGVTQEEFLEISKQISSLLIPSDDEN